MLPIIGVLSLVFIPVSLIIFIVQAVRKKPSKKTWGIITIAAVVVFALSMGLSIAIDGVRSPAEQNVADSSEFESSSENAAETVENTDSDEDEAFVAGDTIEGTIEDISPDDNLLVELVALGFTDEEADAARKVLLSCGIDSIEDFEATSSSASIDDLISYRKVIDGDRTAWFTVDHREIFYVSLNGVDLYDSDQGGFLMDINDVHIPESYISLETADTLKDMTESTLDQYFINASYYDEFGYAREDDNYMVQCQAYASNRIGIKDWVTAKVWFEDRDGEFVVVGVVIDGQRYQ